MFYYLFYELLYQHYGAQFRVLRVMNVFQYLTFRTAYAAITALVLCLVLGPRMIRKLREFNFGQQIREHRNRSRSVKKNPAFDCPLLGVCQRFEIVNREEMDVRRIVPVVGKQPGLGRLARQQHG